MTQQKPTASLPTNGERNKALQDAMRQIEKHFGHGAVMFLGQSTTEPIDVISTGSMALNAALGIGGYPRGASWKSMGARLRARLHWHSMPLPKCNAIVSKICV